MQGCKCRSWVLWCKEAEKKNRNGNTLIGQKGLQLEGYTKTNVRNYDQKSSGPQLKERGSRTPNYSYDPRRRNPGVKGPAIWQAERWTRYNPQLHIRSACRPVSVLNTGSSSVA
ncbi:hypothetical protein TNCV_977471 [Trichonephila clavipes]|nr:hypothetical protein TNCV_977471 [Trichonephila clavipes]